MDFVLSGYRLPKKLVREKSLTKIRKKGLLQNATKYLKSRENLRRKLDTQRTSSGRHFFLKINVTLKKDVKGPIKNHQTRNSFIKKWRSQLFKQDPLKRITNVRVPNEPNAEFDDIVVDEDVASRNTKQDDALLKKLMSNENGLALDKPVRYDSNVDKNEDDAATQQPNIGKKYQAQSYGVESGIKGGIANSNDTEPDEKQSTRKQVSKFNKEHEEKKDKDNEDEDKGQDEEDEEDERKPAEVIKEEEEQLLQLLNNDHKMEPMDVSDRMNQAVQAFMPNFQENQGQFNQQRQFETMKELQAKQEMLQRLQLANAGNIMLQNTQTPQYLSQQLRPFTSTPMRVSIVYGPTTPNYRHPTYEVSFPSSSPLAQTAHQGYSIDVDGVKGIFTKNPGFALRFQSPNSEVTVIKRKDTVFSPRIGY